MRILHVTYSLAADQGGPTMVTTRVASAQSGLGHEVTILTRASAGKETELPPIAGSARVKIERIAPSSVAAKVSGRDSRPRLRELIARHDVVHVHNIWDPILIHAVNEARRQKKPVVLSPHGILTRWALSEKRLKKAIAMRLLYRRAIDKVSMVHALSSFEREEMEVFGFRGPVVVVPNGVFLEEIDPLPEAGEFRSALNSKYFSLNGELNCPPPTPSLREGVSEPFVLFLSRLHPIKGLDILVDAFAATLKRVPNGRLVIIGPDFGMEAPIREQAARLGIADRVHLTGPIFGRGKYEAMVDCACFCLPSGHEAFSVAIAEAMACRACVVISPECHLPEAAEEGAGLVVERSAARLADALEKVLRDEAMRRAMGERGRKLVEERFTWEKVAEALVEAYQKC
ncbi:MAG: glycosyltransferase [Phycisphaeraceae bacterium]|nr:glycosyltransferase [Phycisphaeraceae bacterium]